MSDQEKIGFHKGALTTLAKERQELARILQIVEQLMQVHIKGLKDLGIDIEAEMQKASKEAEKGSKKRSSKKLEDALK